ncbi:MAG: anchored repeat-type ABC transporter permease subunit [Propioniciclava sp.]
MMNPLDFLADLLNPDLTFLPKALAVAVMSSLVCGVVGCHVVLRGMAFIGDAVAHAVFPGLAVAFVLAGNLVLGGTIAGVITAVLVAVFSQNRRLKEDSIIGIFFVAAFALGIVVISQAPGYAGSLQQFLFGSITGIPDSDLIVVGVTGLAVLAALFCLHKEFVTISLDRESARAMGVPVFRLDLVLYVLVTLAVVISVQTIGNILVLALLITPAATARMLTDRLGVMMLLAPAFGALAAVVGLYVSWSWDLPTGGTVVLVLTAFFLAAWFLSPRQGLLALARRRALAGHTVADGTIADRTVARHTVADDTATHGTAAAPPAAPRTLSGAASDPLPLDSGVHP